MKRLSTLGLLATAIVYVSPVAAEDGPDAEIYGTLVPFFENVGTSGATPAGTESGATQVPSSLFQGINHERRFRMTAGTSNIGFRGDLPVADNLKIIWQVENLVPIDGEGPNTWATRNSHVGLTGGWGTITFGNWDTPMKWATVTTVNPIKAGYVADYIPIIGTPGMGVPALNADTTLAAQFEIPFNRAGFYRHESNMVQYWTPNIEGFSARIAFATNELRTVGVPGTEPPFNPYLLSGYVGYDNFGLRLRYAVELHNDYFGMANMGGLPPGNETTASTDIGHLGVASYTLNEETDHKTRLVVVGDYLSYKSTEPAPTGQAVEYSRIAYYALIQQTFGGHNIWAAYGAAPEGKCVVTGFQCTTTGTSAYYLTAGYLYSFTPSSGMFAIGYGLFNDVAARHSPFPYLASRLSSIASLPPIQEIHPGADTIGFGVGFVHSFSAKIFGKDEATPAGKH